MLYSLFSQNIGGVGRLFVGHGNLSRATHYSLLATHFPN